MPKKLIVAALILAFAGHSLAQAPAAKVAQQKKMVGPRTAGEDTIGRTVFPAKR
jgi:hypothetical protein